MRRFLLAGAVTLALPLPLSAQIVGHARIDAVPNLPACVIDAVGAQRWFFTHASVGGNLLEGLDDLRAAEPARYRLVTAPVGYDGGLQRAEPPPGTTAPGTVYECARGNPGWAEKLAIFDRSVRLSGWRAAAVDVVLDKLCYIDPDADAAAYLASMDALTADFPATVFVLATMPLTTSEDGDNVLRNLYNESVRAHAAASGALLYDLADMEAHDPGGGEHTFSSGGQSYQKLYSGYTTDGGHLDTALGRDRMAQGWYAVAATLAPCSVFADGFESGDAGRWSAAAP